MDASKITELLQKQNTRYINRCQTVDSSTLIWKNQIQSSKYIKGVKTCEGAQNCNVPTNPSCPDRVTINGQTQNTGINSFGGAGRTSAIQTGSPQQFLNVLSGASGSASEVYSSERILLQQAGKESCGVPGTNNYTVTTTDNCGISTTSVIDNSYVTLPACYCENTNGPTGPRYNVIGQNPCVGQWATRIGSSGTYQPGQAPQELIDSMATDLEGNTYVLVRKQFGIPIPPTDPIVTVISDFLSNPAVPSGNITVSTYGTITTTATNNNFYIIIKYNKFGQVQWVTKIDSIVTNELAAYITVDTCGNVYVIGTLSAGVGDVTVYNANTQDPNGGTIVTTIYGKITRTGTRAFVFLVKYSPSGQVLAVTKTENDRSSEISAGGVTVSNNAVYITFWTNIVTTAPVSIVTISEFISPPASPGDTIDIKPYGTITVPPLTIGRKVFIVKYDLNLKAQWATATSSFGLGSPGGQQSRDIVVDLNNNVYVSFSSGGVTPNIQLNNFLSAPGGGGSIILTPYGTTIVTADSTVIVKYSSTGQCLGATTITRGPTTTNITVQITSMDIDSSNNLVVTGFYNVTSGTDSLRVLIRNFVSAPGGTGALVLSDYGTLASSGQQDGILIKYNSSLQALWATSMLGTAGDISYSVTVDKSDNIYVTGRYQSNPIVINNFIAPPGSPGGAIAITEFGRMSEPDTSTTSVFLVKYTTNGQAVWATRVENTDLTGTIKYSIGVDSEYNIYIAGPYNSANNPARILIDNFSSITGAPPIVNLSDYASLVRTNGQDSFIIKYAQPPLLQEIPFPINNQSNPYLPAFDTYYAMKNPQCNQPVQDQNQKHFVKQCHSRFPNANNGVNAVFSPCDNVTELDPVTKKFYTTTRNPPTCDDCIIQQ
jgi:hypothetical protein